MKVHEAIAAAFVAERTEVVFTVMGDAVMHWFIAMDERGVRMVSTRHESGAAAMADGYARATGKVGVFSTTAGPGLTQIGTQLIVAARARTPMVVFVGDVAVEDDLHPQVMNQRAFVEACESGFVRLRSAASALTDTLEAFRRARVERRPIVLSAAKNIQALEYPWAWDYSPSDQVFPSLQRICPDVDALDTALTMITESTHPVIIAGKGAWLAGAGDAIENLADQTGALLTTTLLAKGWFADNQFCVGIAGAFSSAVAEELFVEADLVIGIGASLNHFTTEGDQLFPNAHVLAVNIDPQFTTELSQPDHLLCADALTGTHALVDGLKARGYANTGFRVDETVERFVAWTEPPNSPPGKVDPRHAMLVIDRYLDDASLVVLGIGHYWSFPVQYLHGATGGDGFLYTHQFGAIGQCMSSAIGAAIGRPDRRVVAFEGDAGFMMHMQELDTAARNGVGLLVVVQNDESLGAELHQLNAEGMRNLSGALIPTPDLASVATAMGWEAMAATCLEDVETALERYSKSTARPFLLDLRVSTSSVSAPYRKLKFGEPNTAPHQGLVAARVVR